MLAACMTWVNTLVALYNSPCQYRFALKFILWTLLIIVVVANMDVLHMFDQVSQGLNFFCDHVHSH